MLKILVSILLGLCFSLNLIAQDGSNIKYYKPNMLDYSLIGKSCYIDIGKLSFNKRSIDTITINVQRKLMKFYEHREDNGFNNWFNSQYLIRLPDSKDSKTLLKDSKIDSLTDNKIYVTSILSYNHLKLPLDTITVFQHNYDKKNIAEVLIKE